MQYSRLSVGADSDRIFQAAQEYNGRFRAGLEPAYGRQLRFDGTDVMARLVLPTAGIDLPVYHGTSDWVLHRGVGHVESSDLPVGGEGTNSVLTAHTGLPHASMFDSLHEVEVGDPVKIIVAGRTLTYQVTEKKVVDPVTAARSAVPQQGKDVLTLITCTPYAVNTHRLLVTAHRIEDGVLDESTTVRSRMLPWWSIPYTGAVLAVLGAGRSRASRRLGPDAATKR